MNITFSKQLHDSITNANKGLLQEEYKLNNAKSAAKLSLYYTHGNTEKNAINFQNINSDKEKALLLDEKSLRAVSLANNALLAAKQALVDSSLATNNISTAANGMQAATNAITKLSSDVAGILAIANASDFGSKIQQSIQEAYEKARVAAKMAEEVSLISLQTTIEAAQSTASTVVKDAEMTLSSITALNKVTTARYTDTSNKVVTAVKHLTEARKVEKIASATYDIAFKQDQAIRNTLGLINSVSNNNLQLFDPVRDLYKGDWKNRPKSNSEAGESYSIYFDAFKNEKAIRAYHVVMVKSDAAGTFDINLAKDLRPGTYKKVEPKGYSGYSHTFYLLGTDKALISTDPYEEEPCQSGGANSVEHKDIRGIAIDYRGKPIENGVNYVAFVYAVFTEDYQKRVNNTDGYLSLPSEELLLQKNLPAVERVKVHEPYFNSRNFEIVFSVPTEDYDPDLLEYRIMVLDKENVKADEINKRILNAIGTTGQYTYDYSVEQDQLEKLEASLHQERIHFNTLESRIREKRALLQKLNTEMDGYGDSPIPPSMKASRKELKKELKGLKADIQKSNEQRTAIEVLINGDKAFELGGKKKDLEDARIKLDKAVINQRQATSEKTSDFLFGNDLMKVVLPANYYIAKPFSRDVSRAKIKEREAREKFKLARLIARDGIKLMALNQTNIEEAEQKLEEAHQDLIRANAVFTEAETRLNTSEINVLHSDRKYDLSDEEEGTYHKESEAHIKLRKAVDNIRKAQAEFEAARDLVNVRETELKALQQGEVIKGEKMERILADYVYAGYVYERARRIYHLAKRYNETKKRPDQMLFYTELGESATDNYGELLQFSQENIWRYGVELIKNHKKLDREEDVQDLLETLKKESLQKLCGKKKKAYQAVVLTAIKSDRSDMKNRYREQHSRYSKSHVLYGTAD
ncbi:MAG: hypothetical protein HEP71_04490 [Roseivirga sp.]|nr:hypothetical protein [Roseivirga sp.]